MKAISKIIATIMIIMIVVSIAALLWFFLSGLYTSVTTSGKQQIENTTIRGCLIIDNINKKTMEITLRNCGFIPIIAKDLKFYIEDQDLKCFDIEDIEPGKIKSCRLSECLPYGKKVLMITDPRTTLKQLIDFPLIYFATFIRY